MPTPQISTFEQLKNFINENLPDNISGVIDPLDIRTSLLRLIDTQELNNAILYANFSPEQTEVWNSLIDKLEQIQIGNNLGLIKTTDTPPATGKYRGDVATAGTYTNFKNSSGVALAFTQGELDINFGYIYVAENVAEKILTKKPSNSDASVEGNLITFSPNIYFDKPTSFSSKIVNGPITFVPIGSGAKINYGTCVRLIANGVNVPDFSRFKKLSGSQPYENTAGVLNVCFFYFDGIDAWLNLWQGVGASNIDTSDLISPTAPTVVLGEITSNSVQLSWSGATDNVAVTSFEVYKNGILFDTVSASPLVVTGLTQSTSYEFKVKAKDAAGNSSPFSNTISATTTFIYIGEDLVFNNFSNATLNSSTKVLTGSIASSGATITPLVSTLDGFELILAASTDVAVLYLATSNDGAYIWNNVTNMIFGLFRSEGTFQMVKGSTRALAYTHTGNQNYARIKRVGNNAVMAVSNDGATWTTVYTETNGFTGKDTAYIKALFVAAGNLTGYKK